MWLGDVAWWCGLMLWFGMIWFGGVFWWYGLVAGSGRPKYDVGDPVTFLLLYHYVMFY